MNSKQITILIMAGIILIALTLPASADKIIPTSTKVFFEKNGGPYNGTVSFTVSCHGYIIDDTEPNAKHYWLKGKYQRKEPGTYDQTEVFSYSATVDHYGDEIFEPFYLNYRVIDYCTLSGETNGQKFVIENAGVSPIPDCKMRERIVGYQSMNLKSDVCYINNNQSDKCRADERESKSEAYDQCEKYLEEFDKNKLYPEDTRTFDRNGKTIIITEAYERCTDKADSIDLNCTVFDDEVSCSDYCDPDGNPLYRDCNLHYTIPTDKNGNIIETDTKQKSGKKDLIITPAEPESQSNDANNETDVNNMTSEDFQKDTDDNLFTAIMKFLGLIK
ncbi:hypothetical protein [Methanoplanus endosymbiosus]|uniref:Uncharacterized protein n=1 Tax=Methanoplanus endosymbiosus TaxID=33865 RepID=A0A9E7PMB6_9EURY|nr:hypothetical protein [Methanoplanus endosymbiosus]UUX91967.1 hypothetical protein L6E24_11455 [Methanoplanus endosymbiosus]